MGKSGGSNSGVGVTRSGGSGRGTVTASGITFDKSSVSKLTGEVLVKVNVAKLDKAWAKDSGLYISPTGSNAIGNRLASASKFIASGKTVHASSVHIDKGGRVVFRDGRHRFATVRNSGKSEVVIAVKRSEAARAKRFFGGE